MTKPEALNFKDKIKSLCQKEGIWHHVTEENRPKLGKIIIEISIKVDNDE